MVLTALRSQSEPKRTPCSTEWCESGHHVGMCGNEDPQADAWNLRAGIYEGYAFHSAGSSPSSLRNTSIAHLAGALGTPVWVLLSSNPDWRWLLDRDDCPWYPTARLFRQSAHDDWDGVVERVGAALSRLAGS